VPPVGAIVLAAGAGRRIGRGPKALLSIDGVTFLERCVTTCREVGCEPVWVVVRPDFPELVALAASLPVQVVVNNDPERGMFSSVRCGLSNAISPNLERFVLYPVDHPRVSATTIRQISNALHSEAWVVPRFEGQSGHPIGIGIDVARRHWNRSAPGGPMSMWTIEEFWKT
jgi:molybdenum cofactor cytidylyltransferase